jgi:FtsP/CotA-like multicopper oxidase with cupredoxin domain
MSRDSQHKAAFVIGIVAVTILRAYAAASAGATALPEIPHVTPANGVTMLTLRAQANRGQAAFTYRGGLVPPTIHVVPGGELRVTYVNDLPPHSSEQCALGPCMDMTNLHFHGMEVSPHRGQDDILTMLASPGQTLHYDVHVPRDVPPGLYWYRTHPHGESERQALDGMSGAIVVDGIDRYVPQLRTMPERILVLRTTEFSANDPSLQSLMRRLEVGSGSACHSQQIPDQLFTVNGAFRPSVSIAPGERQFWRILNASADDYTDLSVDGSSLRVVAFDGEPLAMHDPAHPTRTFRHIVIPPAGRVEAIVTGPPSGIHAALRMHCVDTGPDGDPMRGQVLADIASDGAGPRPAPVRALLGSATYKEVDLSLIEHGAPSFVATFTEGHHRFYINDRLFSPTAAPMTTVRVGTYVHWRIVNRTHEIHPFHIHQVHFLTYAVNGKTVANPIWADTMNVPLEQSIDVVLDATSADIRGLSVFHCHILSHEDKGMMAKVLFK